MTDSFVHPVISIITPARNQERYIQEMLRSIQAQSFQQWECIVVDDASTDGTADAVHSLHDPRIRLISHEVRQGVSHARNTGMAHAAGTFLYFLDG
ncbi:MAG TPA: glycosyltransferase family A protein, partial [Candidatus Hydrogenedentes bacterium]|nr:glycosyltransferase family A protein [Candidatus Hydrogenedentota bacterium]